jgi:hypothetical protein
MYQVHRQSDGALKRVKGAAVCYNTKCPKRVFQNATTTNRDENGARNIALIGFSSLVSKDGKYLPVFSRSYSTTNKTK